MEYWAQRTYRQVSPAQVNPDAQIAHSLLPALQDRIQYPYVEVEF